MGDIYFELKDFSIALDYYKRAFEINEEINNLVGEATNRYKIGAIHEELGNELEAEKEYRRALIIARQSNEPVIEVDCLTNIADLNLYYHNNLIEALRLYEESLKLVEQHGFLFKRIRIIGGIAEIYSNQGRESEAKQIFEEIWELGNKLGMSFSAKMRKNT